MTDSILLRVVIKGTLKKGEDQPPNRNWRNKGLLLTDSIMSRASLKAGAQAGYKEVAVSTTHLYGDSPNKVPSSGTASSGVPSTFCSATPAAGSSKGSSCTPVTSSSLTSSSFISETSTGQFGRTFLAHATKQVQISAESKGTVSSPGDREHLEAFSFAHPPPCHWVCFTSPFSLTVLSHTLPKKESMQHNEHRTT